MGDVAASGELRVDVYQPSDSEAAMELETRSAQGRRVQLRFDRPYFHRRAENFETWRLLTARLNGSLVAVAAGALKPVILEGRPTSALYCFDVRVAPGVRRSGIAQRLLRDLSDWGNAEIRYGYAVDDNEASLQLCREWMGAGISPACCYLVYPVYKSAPGAGAARRADPLNVHAAYLEAEGPFDFYADPGAAFASEGYVGSWQHERGRSRAACSVWSNREIFAEVVQRLPPSLAAFGAVRRTWPLNLLPGPHIPRPGERIRSWYIFDFHASDDAAAAALMETVAGEARARGIDFCYIIHRHGRPWARALRRRFPRVAAPMVSYSIIGGTRTGEPLFLNAPYIDIRDV